MEEALPISAASLAQLSWELYGFYSAVVIFLVFEALPHSSTRLKAVGSTCLFLDSNFNELGFEKAVGPW